MFNRNSLVAVLSAAGLMALSGAALAQQVVVSGGATLPEKLYNDEITNFPKRASSLTRAWQRRGQDRFPDEQRHRLRQLGCGALDRQRFHPDANADQRLPDDRPGQNRQPGGPRSADPDSSVATPVTVSQGSDGRHHAEQGPGLRHLLGKFTKWSQVGVTVPPI